MRGGICSIQLQALTQEATSLVKQAVNLATRRGHTQVTPLHVASSMLSNSTGLLRKACIQCHSHPLQSKALELCFNVALNRLPSSTLLSPQYSSTPSLSNALVAAFKRAQAHQRRGSVENQPQQQHVLALKIEVEQLLISILDDPSVSRVMREAGFSSTLVKSRVEVQQLLPMQVTSTKVSHSKDVSMNNDDVTSVLNELVKRRRRNTVIVGESVENVEGVAKGVMERFEVGNVPKELRYVQIVSFPLICFRNISKEEVEKKFFEVKSVVKSYMGRGVILYLGDLKWLFEFWSSYSDQKMKYYCSVHHMVMEVKKLVSGSGFESTRLWLLGVANFKTYMKCKICYPSLETIWELHPFTIPVGSLSLSLTFDSDFQGNKERSMVLFKELPFEDKVGVGKLLTCCKDCSKKFENEALSMSRNISKKTCSSSLPTWLQNCKEERSHVMEDQKNAKIKDLCKKWNSICKSVHRNSSNIFLDKQDMFVSSPSSPTSFSSVERKTSFEKSQLNWPMISEQEKAPKECELLYTESANDDDCYDGNLIVFMPHRNVPKPDLLSNPNSSPNSASSSEANDGLESTEMFNENNEENLKILCDALENKFPLQHKESIQEIASTVLFCRSGKRVQNLIKRENNHKQETWMLFLGDEDNSQIKENISKELAKVVFGSYSNFTKIGISKFSSLGEDHESHSSHKCDEKSKRKRPRHEFGSTYLQRFGEAVNENPHRVLFMEDFDQVDNFTQKGIEKAIESGILTTPGGESVLLKDAIVIFSCENLRTRNSVSKSDTSVNLSLDLNLSIEDDHDNLDTSVLELVDKKISFNFNNMQDL